MAYLPEIRYIREDHGGIRAIVNINGETRWASEWAPDEKAAAESLIRRLALWALELHAIADQDADARREERKEDAVAEAWKRILNSCDFITYEQWSKGKKYPTALPMQYGSFIAWLHEIGVRPKPEGG